MQLLSQLPYTQRETRRKLVSGITLDEVVAYRDALIKNATPEMMAVGNLSADSVTQLGRDLKQQMQCKGTHYWHSNYLSVEKPLKANLEQHGSSTDSALAALYIPLGYDEYQSMANSAMLSQIVQPWFYNQLRTEEQLGYAVFAFRMPVGRQWGIGFLLQSNSKQPAYLMQRYQAFYPQAEQRLRTMSQADFTQYQQAMLNDLRQRPQTLNEEADRFSRDFDRQNDDFDTRQKLMEQVQQLTPAGLADFFQQAVMQKKGMAMTSQIAGSGERKTEFAPLPGWRTWQEIAKLQQSLPVKSETQ